MDRVRDDYEEFGNRLPLPSAWLVAFVVVVSICLFLAIFSDVVDQWLAAIGPR